MLIIQKSLTENGQIGISGVPATFPAVLDSRKVNENATVLLRPEAAI